MGLPVVSPGTISMGMDKNIPQASAAPAKPDQPQGAAPPPALPKEIGGAKGPEPTRYGDWEHKGRCTDF